MTPQELEDAIRRVDVDGLQAMLLAATEAERRAASATAVAWCRAIMDVRLGNPVPPGFESPVLQAQGSGAYIGGMLALGCASITQVRENGWRFGAIPESGYDLLAARPLEWRQAWVEWSLSQPSIGGRYWQFSRRLVREGLCPRPEQDGYILGMLGQPWTWTSVYQMLLDDPGLLEWEVWRLFEVEGVTEMSLAAHDKYSKDDQCWNVGLLRLSSEGRISRDRLLDASLDALARDFAQFRAGWYSRLHEALNPTREERAVRLETYLRLLDSRIPPTVAFALKALASLDKPGLLPPDRLVAKIEPALFAREKGTVSLALRLLESAVRRSPILAAGVADRAADALRHESPECQSAALQLLERHGNAGDPALREKLAALGEAVASSLRPRVAAWLGDNPKVAEPTPAAAPVELLTRADAVGAPWRELAGIDAAIAALQSAAAGVDRPAAPLELADRRIPRLDPAARLRPIEELEELLELFTVVLENEGPPDDLERVLDGVSRLCDRRPPDWERRVAPLRKRLSSLSQRLAAASFDPKIPTRLLCRLGLTWLGGELPEIRGALSGTGEFLVQRVEAITRGVAEGRSGPLLSLPTHSGGWIDPRTLVSRLYDASAANREPEPRDLILALFRLAPDHRADALEAANGLPGEPGDAIRHALGAEGASIGPSEALWSAAARARHPDQDDPAVAARHPQSGGDGARVAHLRLDSKRHTFGSQETQWVMYTVELVVDPPPLPEFRDDLPASELFRTDAGMGAGLVRWARTLWPAGWERWAAAGCKCLGDNLDWDEAEWPNRVFLEMLTEPDTPLGPIARSLLAVGLGCKEPGERGLATDALLLAIEDGRLDGDLLGDDLARLIRLSLARPGRWTKALLDVARHSPLHVDTVRRALEHAITEGAALRPADLAALLEILHELSVECGRAVELPAARSVLESVKSGKGGKLAKALLSLAPAPKNRISMAEGVLGARLARTERWREWASGDAT